jgi:hypothetical protein
MLIFAIGINFFMQASGNDAVMYYLSEVFKVVGIRSKKKLFGINVIMDFSKSFFLCFTFGDLLDKFWRRPLLLIGSFGKNLLPPPTFLFSPPMFLFFQSDLGLLLRFIRRTYFL